MNSLCPKPAGTGKRSRNTGKGGDESFESYFLMRHAQSLIRRRHQTPENESSRALDAALNTFVAALLSLSLISLCPVRISASPPSSSLAIINAGISASDDGALVTPDYQFLPGDFVYLNFQISGFAVQSEERDEVRKISLAYDITPQDAAGQALVPPVSDEIKAELSPEDKNWVPKRRASFVIPSFVAAGTFQIHIVVHDRVAKTDASGDVPFSTGGVHVKPASVLSVQNFRFFRRENDPEPLSVAAFSPGDTVHARFEMVGYKFASGNKYHLTYAVSVFSPDGKPYITDPHAANIETESFYPAQFVPGNLDLSIGKDAPRGEYVIDLKIRDLIANQTIDYKQAFAVE